MVLRMKKIFIVFCLISISLSSCYEPIQGSGNVIEKEIELPYINSVCFDGIGTVNISKADSQKVLIRADDNFIDIVKIKVDSGSKLINIRTMKNIAPSVLEINISMSDFNNFSLEGEGDIIFNNSYDHNGNLFLSNSGRGKLEFLNLACNKAFATVYSSGDIYVSCKNELDANIKSSGNIYYSGDNIKINSYITGKGKIIKLD